MAFINKMMKPIGSILLVWWLSACSFQKQISTSTSTTNASPIRYEIVEDARGVLGAGYRYGATGNKRYDCSGLVYSLYSSHQISLPRSTKEMSKFGQKIDKGELLPGDLVFFRHSKKIDHVAMVSRMSPAKTWLIHSTTSRGVIEQILEESPYWSKRVAQYRRIIP